MHLVFDASHGVMVRQGHRGMDTLSEKRGRLAQKNGLAIAVGSSAFILCNCSTRIPRSRELFGTSATSSSTAPALSVPAQVWLCETE